MQIAKFSSSLLVTLWISTPAFAQTSEITAAPAGASPAPTEAAPAPEAGPVDPVILHAEALLAEADGNVEGALTMLRQASALAPDDEVIAYDLARLARKTKSQNAADFEPLNRIAPTAQESALLKAVTLSERGDAAGAKRVLDTYAAEASVRTAGDGAGTSSERKWWSARARLASQFDSNVALWSNETSGQAAYRLNINASLTATPFAGRDFAVTLALSTGPHLNRTASVPMGATSENIGFFDASSVVLALAYGQKFGDARLGLSFATSQTFIELVSSHFAQDAAIGAELAYKLGNFEGGVFGNAGYRDFSSSFNDEEPTVRSESDPERGYNDRDGALVSGGLRARLQSGIWSASVQGGYQLEAAQGRNQSEAGPAAGLSAAVDLKPVRLSAGATYELRDYADSQIVSAADETVFNKRSDRRTTAAANASFTAMSGLDVLAGYTFILNDSLAKFDYDRHLVTVGVEGRW